MRRIVGLGRLMRLPPERNLDQLRPLVNQGPLEVVQLARLQRAAGTPGGIRSQQRRFVSAVSHELRTPLTIVQGYLQRTIRRGDNR